MLVVCAVVARCRSVGTDDVRLAAVRWCSTHTTCFLPASRIPSLTAAHCSVLRVCLLSSHCHKFTFHRGLECIHYASETRLTPLLPAVFHHSVMTTETRLAYLYHTHVSRRTHRHRLRSWNKHVSTRSRYTPFTRSSNHQANIEQLEHTSCTCIMNAFAGCLLDDCWMIAWSCKRDIALA